MNKLKFSALLGAALALLAQAATAAPPAAPAGNILEQETSANLGLPSLSATTASGAIAHFMPNRQLAGQIAAQRAYNPAATDVGPLAYHAGGQIMPSVTAYAIYWVPAKLQDGTTVPGWPAAYQNLLTQFLTDYPSHSHAANTTQYYQTVSGVTSYISGGGSFGGAYVDTSAFPASGCKGKTYPKNCMTDAQIVAEIKKVMTLKGWTPGINKMYFVFTPKFEESCFDSSTGSPCSYTYYCAYHSAYGTTASPVIYANMPYAAAPGCVYSTTPNGNAEADTAASVTSHELIEAVTDPFGNAWYTSAGNEIGDLCAWNYGTNTWGATATKNANEFWNGHYYELQQEYDNHAAAVGGTAKGCVQAGP